MNILITSANGFIARDIIAALQSEGHTVVACVRKVSTLLQKENCIRYIQADFTRDTNKDIWIQRLTHIDVVINCVGVFQTTKKKMWAIHYHAPCALFDACQAVGVKKIIQISALGVDKSDVAYAKSKLAAETHLQKLPIDSVIIRPSFVYAQGVYGGSALFRGLSALPFFIFLPGGGKRLLQPI